MHAHHCCQENSSPILLLLLSRSWMLKINWPLKVGSEKYAAVIQILGFESEMPSQVNQAVLSTRLIHMSLWLFGFEPTVICTPLEGPSGEQV